MSAGGKVVRGFSPQRCPQGLWQRIAPPCFHGLKPMTTLR